MKMEKRRVYMLLWPHETRNGMVHWRRSIEAMGRKRDAMEAATFFGVIPNRFVNMIRQDVLFSTYLAYFSTTCSMQTMVGAYIDDELSMGGGGPMTETFANLQTEDMLNAI